MPKTLGKQKPADEQSIHALADELAESNLPVQFWQAMTLGLLRRAERKEPGLSTILAERLDRLLRNLRWLRMIEEDPAWPTSSHIPPNQKIEYRREHIDSLRKSTTREIEILEDVIPSLVVDRRKLKPDPWPIPRWDLDHQYGWLFFIIRTLKRVLRQDGLDEAARRVWGNFHFDSPFLRIDLSYEEYVAAIGGNPLKLWAFALLLGFFKFGDVERPDDPTLETMARACMAEPPGTAALSILELCCTIKDPKTGKLRTLSADKIKQYISRARANYKVKESLRERFRMWEEEGFRYLATGEDPDVEKRLAAASNGSPAT